MSLFGNNSFGGGSNGGGASSFSQLTDFETSVTPTEGNILTYTNGKWKPTTVSVGNTGMQDYIGGTLIDLVQPLEVKKLSATYYNKTSITLSWKPSNSTNIQDYTIYNGNTFVGSTTGTTFTINGLTSASTYNLTVKSRNTSNIESNGYPITTKTSGNFALSLNKQWLESPLLSFSMIEMHMILTPKVSSWNNVLVDSVSTNYKMTFQYDGARLVPINMIMNDNGVVYGLNQNPPLNQDKVYQMQTSTYDLRVVTDSVRLLGWVNGAITDIVATVYQVKFWKINDLNQFDLVADYDCTYSVVGTNIPDRLGINPPLVMHGGIFIAN
jgi:hypothetical protein